MSCNILVVLVFVTELIESTMYLYRATKDPYLLEVGVDILESIEQETRTECGYATVSKTCFCDFYSIKNRVGLAQSVACPPLAR